MPVAPFTGIQACLAGCQQVIACTRLVLGLAHSTYSCALGLRLLMIRARIECTLQNDLCKSLQACLLNSCFQLCSTAIAGRSAL